MVVSEARQDLITARWECIHHHRGDFVVVHHRLLDHLDLGSLIVTLQIFIRETLVIDVITVEEEVMKNVTTTTHLRRIHRVDRVLVALLTEILHTIHKILDNIWVIR